MICETQVTAQIKRMITGGNYGSQWSIASTPVQRLEKNRDMRKEIR